MAKYGRRTQKKVEKVMHERKHGSLRSGSGRKVRSRKQAIAIALSEARREGDKVPPRKSSSKSRSRKASGRKTSGRKSSARKSTARKSTTRKSTSRKSRSRKSSGR